MKNSRGLSQHLFIELLNGKYSDLLSFIKKDDTLDLQIREDYFNVYYRGGNILKVENKVLYPYSIDKNYFESSIYETINQILKCDIIDWFTYFGLCKQAMDLYFTKNKKEEREFQQLIVRENNYSSIANSTDYFIVDIEYDNRNNARFDLIAIEWESTSQARKLHKKYTPKFVVIEMKYGDGALVGNAGMNKHYDDFKTFIQNEKQKESFINEMSLIFNQKRKLGLIPSLSENENNNIILNYCNDIDLMFLIANHDPDSTKLYSELKSMPGKAQYIVSNYMGYALYKDSVQKHSEFFHKLLLKHENKNS